MVIYSTVKSRCYIINIRNTGIGVHKNFSMDRQSRHFACPFQTAHDTMKMGVHITLYLSTPQRKWLMLRQQPKNALRWQQGFFSHRIKGRGLVTYCNQQSLSRCITCHRCLQQSHAAKRLLPQLEVNLCCHVTVTQWRPILELSAPKFRNLPLQAVERTCVNCKLKIAWHYNSEPNSCAVWLSYRKIKPPLQELNQLSCWLQVF